MTRPARLALVALVLTGVLLGTGTVRALDVRPTADFDAPGPVDGEQPPETIFTTESVPESETSYHAEQRSTCWNESTESWESPVIFDLEHDPPDRRMRLSFLGPDEDGEIVHQQTAYFSPKTFATKYGETEAESETEPEAETETQDAVPTRAWYQRTAGDWIVYSGIGYYLVEHDDGWVPRKFIEQGWTVAEETDDAVVLTASDAEDAPPLGDGDPIDEATEVKVHVDRETGLLIRVHREGYSSAEEPEDECARRRLTMTFGGWGTTEVERPAQIDEVAPLEWLWAVAYY